MTRNNNLHPTSYILHLGFTLIELLIVISIIGILVTIISASFVTSQKQARDVQRKSDLRQYQNSLESFANGNKSLFPARSTAAVVASTTLCSDLNVYLNPDIVCSEDPKPLVYTYKYWSDGTDGTVNATTYVLWAKLESASTTAYWVLCSNGRSGSTATVPVSAVCPI